MNSMSLLNWIEFGLGIFGIISFLVIFFFTKLGRKIGKGSGFGGDGRSIVPWLPDKFGRF